MTHAVTAPSMKPSPFLALSLIFPPVAESTWSFASVATEGRTFDRLPRKKTTSIMPSFSKFCPAESSSTKVCKIAKILSAERSNFLAVDRSTDRRRELHWLHLISGNVPAFANYLSAELLLAENLLLDLLSVTIESSSEILERSTCNRGNGTGRRTGLGGVIAIFLRR